MYYTKKELKEAVKFAVDYLKSGGDGCYTFSLDNRLAVCVGWSAGYDPKDSTCIHNNSDKSYCLNIGLKVWTSDSMRTDYDYINSPYFDSGDVWMTDCSIGEDTNVDNIVDGLLDEYEAIKQCVIEEDGRIADCKCPEDYCSGLVD